MSDKDGGPACHQCSTPLTAKQTVRWAINKRVNGREALPHCSPKCAGVTKRGKPLWCAGCGLRIAMPAASNWKARKKKNAKLTGPFCSHGCKGRDRSRVMAK